MTGAPKALSPGWRWIAFYLAGAFVVLFEKIKFPLLNPGLGEQYWASWHAKAMANTIGAPLQYRVLSYLLPEVPHSLGMSVFGSYLLVRFLCVVAICALLHQLWRPWLRRDRDVAAGLLGFLLLYMMSTLPMPQPAEPINIVFIFACYLALQRGRIGWLYPLVLLGALNKLTVVFVAPVVFFHLLLGAQKRDVKAWLWAAIHGGALFLLAGAVRLVVLEVMGKRTYISELVLGPMVLVWLTWRRQPALNRAHSLMLPLFVVSHFAITIMAEFRTQIMTLALTIPAVLAVAFPDTEPETGPEQEEESEPEEEP